MTRPAASVSEFLARQSEARLLHMRQGIVAQMERLSKELAMVEAALARMGVAVPANEETTDGS